MEILLEPTSNKLMVGYSNQTWTNDKAIFVPPLYCLLGIKCTRHFHCQKKFPLPVEKVPTAKEKQYHYCEDCTATKVKKKLSVKVTEFGDSYEVPANAATTGTASDGTGKKKGRTITLTAEDIQKRKNNVKARTTLLLSLPDEHQLRFNKYKTKQEIWAAILKTFDGNEAIKKMKKNLLKQQYGNFKAEGLETLEQTLAPEWLMHTIVWRNMSDLDTMSLDDLYNLLKTGKKISIQGIDVAGLYKSKVECFNFHKMVHFARECRAPRSQDRGRRHNYRQWSKVEEHALKALMEIDRVGWDWSYMATDEENHALNMIYHYKLGLAQVEARLAEHRDQELKYCEKIRVLEFKTESSADCIENLKKEFELIKKENEGLDSKLTGFQTASKDLDSLLESQRLDKNKEGLGYSDVPPPPAQIYSPPKKDMSWTGLLKFKDDTITDYSRPSPAIESTSDDAQNRNPSEASPSTISPKPFIRFVKANDSPTKSKRDKAEKAKKPPVRYAKQYKKPTKKPNVRGNQRNWNNLKSHQLGPNFVMKKKPCFNCGDFNHLAYDCRKRVRKGTSRSQNNTHKSFTPRPAVYKPHRPPMRPMRSNMNAARPNRTSFNKPTHSYTKRPFQRTSAVRSQYIGPRVPPVSRNFFTINRKFPTAKRKFPTDDTKFSTADMGKNGKAGSSQNNIDDKGYWDSGCSRHMTGNISYLSDYEPFDGGYVSFGQGGCKITHKRTIKTGKLEFENVYFVKDLKYNLFSVSQICDNKNNVLFNDSECIVLGQNFKLSDDDNVLLRTPRQYNMYSIDLNNIVSHKDLTCLVTKASAYECMLWHRRLGHLNFKTMNRLVRHDLVRGLPSKCFKNDHTCIACLKGKQHKASCKSKLVNSVTKPLHTLHMDLFGPTSNGVAVRRNRTLIEAARTMLADAKLPVTFWAEAVNTACYVQNRVLVNKSQNKTPYELFNGRTPTIGFLKPFGCHVMILNTLDNLGKFEAKRDEDVSSLRYIALPSWVHDALLESSSSKPQDDCSTDVPESSGNSNPTATSTNPPANQLETLTVETLIPTNSSPVPTPCFTDSQEPSRVANQVETPSLDNILTLTNRFEDILGVTTNSVDSDGVKADVSNTETNITASPTPTLRIHKDHPKSQIIGHVDTPIQTRNKSKEEEGIDYDEVFTPVVRIEAIRLFLAYASFMGFTVYQMDVKSAFLYGTINEEVGTIDRTLFIIRQRGDFILVQVYVDDIIFRSSNPQLCREFEAFMYENFQMSAMGELNFFLGMQVLQKEDGIFLSQDKYVGDILKKFGYSYVRSSNTPMDKENP
nr:ribonuclease H-like domain-containing protein [Tanacetum cinerariifolium]